MPVDPKAPGNPLPEVPRILGRLQGTEQGPTLLCVAGLHGNEAPGVLALGQILESLEERRHEMSGTLLALSGNRAALARGKRYLHRDLNRCWSRESLRKARVGGQGTCLEDQEQTELHQALNQAIQEARGPVFFLDLHTTSGPGHPFSIFLDSLPSRRFALGLSVPLVFGLGELLDGTLLEFISEQGIPSVVFEAGARDDPESIQVSTAAIWVALASAGVIGESAFPEVSEGRHRLRSRARGLPGLLELRYRHSISDTDDFRMLPGFRSFQRVRAGKVLGHDRRGPVQAPEAGRLLMPLYQDQGEDGFFLTRDFSPFWLVLSEVLRRARAERALPWLPGISKDPAGSPILVVNQGVGRRILPGLLHLLGYRKDSEDGNRQTFIKQGSPRSSPRR